MTTVHVETLAQTVEDVILRKAGGGGVVITEKLQIRDAAAFDMLMDILAADDDWVIGNAEGVKGMTSICTALLLLERTLLPTLRWRPTSEALLGVVSGCANKLREVAVGAGGFARREAGLLSDSILAYVEDALQVSKGSSMDPVLRERVDALKERCSDLLSTQCTISQQY